MNETDLVELHARLLDTPTHKEFAIEMMQRIANLLAPFIPDQTVGNNVAQLLAEWECEMIELMQDLLNEEREKAGQ